jgi:hypothetical protein
LRSVGRADAPMTQCDPDNESGESLDAH